MRSWWRVNVEERLDALGIEWDTLFLWLWGPYMLLVVLNGGNV